MADSFYWFQDVRTIILCSISFLFIAWWVHQRKKLPPGPWGWPILGYLPNLGISLYRSGLQPHQFLANLANRYGKVYSFYLGGQLMVILNSADCVREAFQNQYLNDRPRNQLPEKIIGKGIGVLMGSGAPWKQQRRFTLSTFRSFGVGKRSFQETISVEVEALCEKFDEFKGKSFDPRKFLSNAVSNIICTVIFGKRFDYSDAKFHELLGVLDAAVVNAGSGIATLFVPILRYFNFLSSTDEERIKVKNYLDTFFYGIIDDHRKNFDTHNLRDYIDVYLDEIQEAEKNGTSSHINRDNLRTTIGQLFGAGTETTVTTLRWGLLYMMAHPQIQERVQSEIDSVVGRNRLPNLSDKEQLPFTEATLMEVQRIASIAPLGVPHYASEDTTLFGYTIPKNTMIMSNIWAIHHDPALWNAPDEFQPERFLKEDGLVAHPEEYLPFSAGRRVCLGENLAKMELFIFFSHLLHRYVFKQPQDSALCFDSVGGATNNPVDFKVEAKLRE